MSIEELKKLKASLEERRSSVAAEQKFLEAEKKRVMTKLQSLGFKSLAELKEAKAKLETELAEQQRSLEEAVKRLEAADSETLEVHDAETAKESPVQESVQPEPESVFVKSPASIIDDII